MNNELISVIIPCYNVEKYLIDTFESINNQTYKNFEIIFIDDGSKDNTAKMLIDFSNKHKFARVIQQKNQGVSIARNNGINLAKGDYIIFIDPDDFFQPNLLKHLHDLIKENDYDVSICNYTKVNENKHYVKINNQHRFKKKTYIGENKILAQFLAIKPFFLAPWNKLYKHNVLKQISGYPNLFNNKCKDGDDALFNSLCLSHCKKAIYSSKKLYQWRQRKTSTTHIKFGDKNLTLLENEKFLNSLDKEKFKNIQNDIKSKAAIDNLILLFKFAFSDYKNSKAAREIYSNFKSNIKYVVRSKNNPWYYRFLPLVLPIAYLSIKRKFK